MNHKNEKTNRRNTFVILLIFLALFTLFQVKAKEKRELENLEKQLNEEIGGLPKILSFGSSCGACQEMVPILNSIKEEYQGILEVQHIDAGDRNNSSKVSKYGIKGVPSQVFLDNDGNVLYKSETYLTKEAIINILEELGIVDDNNK